MRKGRSLLLAVQWHPYMHRERLTVDLTNDDPSDVVDLSTPPRSPIASKRGTVDEQSFSRPTEEEHVLFFL